MSTTDDSFSVTHDPIDIQRPSLKERWWHIMDTWKIGIIPLPLFVLAGADCDRLPGRKTAERHRSHGGHAGLLRLCLR